MSKFLPKIFTDEAALKSFLSTLVSRGLKVLLILVVSFLLYEVLSLVLRRIFHFRLSSKPGSPEEIASSKKALTLTTLSQNILKYLIFFIAGFMILKELGVDPAPMIATAGVAGIALGFGAQSLIKDVVSGFFIIFEGWYQVGDFIHLKAPPAEAIGVVEEFGLRTTTLRDFGGNLHYIPNGAIVGVDRYSQGHLSFNLGFRLPKEITHEKLRQVLEDLSEKLAQREPLFLPPLNLQSLKTTNEKTLAQVSLKLLPTGDKKAQAAAEFLKEGLKEDLALKEIPTPFIYQVDPRTVSRYKKSLHLK